MVPSLLPAFSAPTAVSVLPSALASSGEIAACAVPPSAAAAIAASIRLRFIDVSSSSEGRLEGQAQEAAVLQERGEAVLAGDGRAVVAVLAGEVDVLEVEAVL